MKRSRVASACLLAGGAGVAIALPMPLFKELLASLKRGRLREDRLA